MNKSKIDQNNTTIWESFIVEIKNFSKENWWVYVTFSFLLLLIFLIEGGNMFYILSVSIIHFVADIFIMMMISFNAKREYDKATRLQILAVATFFALKIYVGLTENVWHYILADVIFILAAVRSYEFNILKKEKCLVSMPILIISSLFILLGVLLPLSIGLNWELFHSVEKIMFVIGLFSFAIVLGITEDSKIKLNTTILSLLIMVTGAIFVFTSSLSDPTKVVNGLDISFILLPSTVLVHGVREYFKRTVAT